MTRQNETAKNADNILKGKNSATWSWWDRVVGVCLLFWVGAISLCSGQAPPNDHFTNATPLYGNSVVFTGSLDNATSEVAEYNRTFGCGGNLNSIWWAWTATNSTEVVIDRVNCGPYDYCYPGGASSFAVLIGATIPTLTGLDCNFLYEPHRYVHFSAVAGQTYYIRVDGLGGALTLRLTATNAPVILAQPQVEIAAGGASVAEGSGVMFGVIAGGLRPLTYQWRLNGVALPGETAPTLVLHDLKANQAGGYSVTVSNSSGVTESETAILPVFPRDPPLVLTVLPAASSNVFEFAVTKSLYQNYHIETSTNLQDWVQADILGSPFSVARTNGSQFFRAKERPPLFICIAQLRQINFAIHLWANENKHDVTSVVTASDIAPYMKSLPICPWGGTTFADSYILIDVATRPLCTIYPSSHVLP